LGLLYLCSALAKLACPAGKYCPSPREIYDCPTGSFCPVGTVHPLTCNISTLVTKYPQIIMPTKPTTMYQSVYMRGTVLGGNQCPGNATSPQTPCPAGYYCPDPSTILLCPVGYYCKQGSLEPSKCPSLANCPEGSEKANLSWFGFIFLAVILIVLWMAYWLMVTLIRVNQRRIGRTQSARERLWKLLNPLLASNSVKAKSFRAFKAIRPKITLEFEDMGLTLHGGKTILSGVSGAFHHSRVAAIMGPSGAGKSTFLNVVMGKAAEMGRVSGTIKVNGREIKPDDLKGIVGLVPQEDIVHDDLTVRENLVYSARLRLSKSKSLKEQMAIVDDVINVLQLRHVQHQVVGNAEKRGISGGQRKRVNIGWELVSKPSLLFMDEPTSGLDATAAADILQALKRMAGLGMNIITVIHQPRYTIFSLFDDVMLLCKGGMLAYLGPSQLALNYMEELGFPLPPNENPADFALDVLSGTISRKGHNSFQPEELVPLWQTFGHKWVKSQDTPALRKMIQGDMSQRAPEAIDPEQMIILEEVIDDNDADGDGCINEQELCGVLRDLGVEPTTEDVKLIAGELSNSDTGLISKESILQYVRHGGRPPTSEEGQRQNARRLDSLYRVYSIEQYTLGNALSELATHLPPGLKADGPTEDPMTLKQMAIACMERAESQKDPEHESGNLDHIDPTMQPTADEFSEEESSTISSIDLKKSEQDEAGSPVRQPQTSSRALEFSESCATLSGLKEEGKKRSLMSRLFKRKRKLRDTPGSFSQLIILLGRGVTKWTRSWLSKFMDILLLILAAVTCGAIHGTESGPNDVRGNTALIMLTMGMLSCTTSLSVFGKDKIVFWREKASGLAVLPYFLANTLVNLVDIAIQPLIFLSIYQSMTLPTISFGIHYIVGLLVVWWTTSAGCLMSVLVGQQSNALVAAVAFVMITGGFINGVSPNYKELGATTKALTTISYNRWAVEAVAIATYQKYPEYLWPLTKALMNLAGYCGLDDAGVPSINKSLRGNIIIASDAPTWDDPWQQAGEVTPNVPNSELEELDISVYCSGYLTRDLIVLAAEGFALRFLTLVALYLCPKGLTLEPLAVRLGNLFRSIKKKLTIRKKRAIRRRTLTAGALSRNV